MAFKSVKLIPGVNVERTPTLLEAGYVSASFGRFRDDLFEKLGGWTKFYPFAISGIPRALHAWQDYNSSKRLAVGATSELGVITPAGAFTDITPQTLTTDVAVNLSTTASSTTVTVVDTAINTVTTYDSVYFNTPIAIGGLILSGCYNIALVLSSTSYQITAATAAKSTRANATISGATQANPCVVTAAAHGFSNDDLVYIYGVSGMTQLNGKLYTVAGAAANTFQLSGINSTGYGAYTSGGTASPSATPVFTTTNGSAIVSVTVAAHGLSVGNEINFPIATTGGDVTIQGTYPVTSVTSASVFTITASNQASSGATFSMNGGSAEFVYYITLGPPAVASGYSIGTYSSGSYSTGAVSSAAQTGTSRTATDYTLDNWGSDIVACPSNGAIYFWDPNGGFLNADLVSPVPMFNTGIFVAMPAQILVAYGSTADSLISIGGLKIGTAQNPLLIRWSDQEDFTNWVPTQTNQSGSYLVPTGSRIVGALQSSQMGLIWTDIDLYSMTYVGGTGLIFAFDKIAGSCGLAGKHARCQIGSTVFWASRSNFFSLTGAGVQPLPCSVWDSVFQDMDTANLEKCVMGGNTPFNEFWFAWPSKSGGTGECDKLVIYNTVQGIWYGPFANFPRSAMIDQSVLGFPITATPTGLIYSQESGYDADNGPITASMQTGYFRLAEGEEYSLVDRLYPDFKWGTAAGSQTAQINLTIYATNYAGDTPQTFGPYLCTQQTEYVSLRTRARFLAVAASSSDSGSFWRLGRIGYRIAPDGRR